MNKLRFNLPVGDLDDVDISADGNVLLPVVEKKKRKGTRTAKPKISYSGVRTTTLDADLRIWQPNYKLITDSGTVSIDTETTGLRYRHGDMPWMISMADTYRNSWCTSFPVDPWTRKVLFTETPEYLYLKKICENPKVRKKFFNRKFDLRNLATIGIFVAGDVFDLDDVSFQARVYNTDEFGYKLKPLSLKYCRLPSDDETDLKTGVAKLRKRAAKYGWKIFDSKDEENTNSKSKEDSTAPDYWLCQYAHILFPEDPEFAQRMKELVEEYCRKDTLRTEILGEFYDKQFEEVPAHKRAYQLELLLSPLVEGIEDRGIIVFPHVAKRERNYCKTQAEILLKEIRDAVKDPTFNPASPADYSNFLFSKQPLGLGLPPTEKTAAGQYKTGNKEIAHLNWHPFIQQVTRWKSLSKTVTLFFDKYIAETMEQEDGTFLIHPEINQSNTKTFRFSYSNPNLQQASSPESSSRGANVQQVRNAFGPRKGFSWWSMDYSGQEFRIIGGLMKVPAIQEAVLSGKEIPTELGNMTWGGKGNDAAIAQAIESLELNQAVPTTREVADYWYSIDWYGHKRLDHASKQLVAEQCLADFDYKIVSLEKVLGKKTVRTRTKMCLYGKAFGAGWRGLIGLLLCKESEAKDFLKKLDNRFPEMVTVANQWASFGKHNGYITNAYGRRLTVDPDFAYRATNYRIQGTAAEMMKISMLRCWEYVRSTGLEAYIVLTIHDELIFEIANKHAYPWFLRGLKKIMEDHEQYVHLPMEVGVSRIRESWDKEEDVEI